MKRSPWPIVASFALFLALVASITYWMLPWLQPPARAVAVAPSSAQPPVVADLRAASTLFGATASAPESASYALKGIVIARKPGDSVAIIAAEGKPPQAMRVGAEVVPGVTLKDVQPQYVVIAESGRERRVELPDAKTEPGEKSAATPSAESAAEAGKAGQERPAQAQPSADAEGGRGSARRRGAR